jgi:hypothetical protein
MIKVIARELVGLLACLAILMPLAWYALKVFFGD